jgi:hypothetical protein
VLGWLVACNGEDGLGLTVELTTPNERAPLVRSVAVRADAPVRVDATWVSADHTASVSFPGFEADRTELLLGFLPDHDYVLTVTATDADGRTDRAEVELHTAPAPAWFPVAAVAPGEGTRAPGHTLIPMNTFLPVSPSGLVFVFDEQGRICWWLDAGDFVADAREWDGGLLVLAGESDGTVVKYAWDGTELGSWSLSERGVRVQAEIAEAFHHDVQPFPDDPDRLVGIGRVEQQVAAYPTAYDDPIPRAPSQVSVDVLVEFDTTGAVTGEWPLDSLIPVDRIGYGSLGEPFGGTGADWSHANAVVFDGPDYLWSLRHQDAILKLDPATGALVWILGYPENWPPDLEAKRLQPVGDVRWPYHQHGPHLLPEGPSGEKRLVVFDNGNFQAAPWTGEVPLWFPADVHQLRSRVLGYTIDEAAGTVSQFLDFEKGSLYSDAVGEAEGLPNGHVLSTWGFLTMLPDGSSNRSAGLGEHSVRVIEIDPATGAEVEELYLSTAADDDAEGWTGYRSGRIEALYGRVVDW